MRRSAGSAGSAARILTVLAVLLLVVPGLAACTSSGHGSYPGALATGCEALGYGASLDGEEVTVSSALSGREIERLEASLAFFEECTGIDVVPTATDSMESDLLSAADAASATGSAAPGSATPAEQDAAGDSSGQVAGQGLPDLAIVPQPGLVAKLADAGVLVPLPQKVNANAEMGWNREWVQVGTYDGVPYAAPLMASVKSFVWFSPTAFNEAGYSVPRTWSELETLTRQVVKDHPDGSVTPWCLGLGDGSSTGWAMTDWLEDVILATQGTGAYDAWASHDKALDSSSAVEALDAVGSLLLAKGRVAGGGKAAATRSVEQAGADLVEGRCLMLHASSSYESILPEGTTVTDVSGGNPAVYSPTPSATEGTASPGGSGSPGSTAGSDGAQAGDVAEGSAEEQVGDAAEAADEPSSEDVAGDAEDVAEAGRAEDVAGDAEEPSAAESPTASASAAPTATSAATAAPTTAQTGGTVSAFLLPSGDRSSEPTLVGADYLVALTDGDAATAVMEYLTSADWAQRRVSLGGVATAHQAVDIAQIPSDVARRATTLLQSRQATVRMDASDSMPAEVGIKALWTCLTQWTAGEMTSKQALAQAEKSWP